MKRDLIKPLHGLRGIAALTVVFGHYGIVTSTPSLGVVLFFILSGFLIGKLYMERPFNTKEVSSYVVARFARIYPLFALVVVGTGVLNMVFPDAQVFYLEPDQIVPHLLLFGSNMTIWTICAEFQFYLVFIAIWWMQTKSRNVWWIILPILFVSFAYGASLGAGAGRTDIFSYLHVFSLGLIISILTRESHPKFDRVAAVGLPIFVVAYATVYFAYPRLGFTERAIYVHPLVLLICAGLLLTSLAAGENWVNRLLSLPPAIWLGEVSFGIYLLHRPVGWALDVELPHHPFNKLGAVAVTMILAQVAHMAIEKPSRDALRKWGATLIHQRRISSP
ncbi:MAG: acyltransferase [Sphingomonadaceae bacterium]